MAGRDGWDAFAASPEASDGCADPLDRWSRRVIEALARELGATALFPFGGPPWLPFQQWARRAEPVHASPIGILIHPRYGLWHSYRGALGFSEALAVPEPEAAASPCEFLLRTLVPESLPGRGVLRPGYDVARLRGPCEKRGRRGLHGRSAAGRAAPARSARNTPIGPNRRISTCARFSAGRAALEDPRLYRPLKGKT